MRQALILDNDVSFQHDLADVVREAGFKTTTASTLKEARQRLAKSPPDVFFVDLNLADGNGLELLEEVDGVPETVLITEKPEAFPAVASFRPGVSDYLTKPVDATRVKMVLAKVARNRELKQQIGNLRGELRRLGRFCGLVGASPAMQGVYDLLLRVAKTDAPIFITGETGTGKKLVARTVHDLSLRAREPFLAVNCAAVSPSVIERELFGQEPGGEAGAEGLHRGLLERADGGTVFLDEITELPPEAQAKLLPLFERSTVTRLGGVDRVRTDVRVITATSRDPEAAVGAGRLREELLYRLNVFPLELPALRDRGEDVELLAEHFLRLLNDREGTAKRFTRAALDRLWSQRWGGNVRELRNLVQRAFLMAEDEIRPESLPLAPVRRTEGGSSLDIGVGTSLVEMERRLILATLNHFEGDKRRAAGALKISLKTLYNRINQYRTAS
jgi:two-component system, NtrC family, response regulator HydG